MTPVVTWRSALAWRMARHGLADRPFGEAVDVSRALCGLHAQVASSAVLTVLTEEDAARLASFVGGELDLRWA